MLCGVVVDVFVVECLFVVCIVCDVCWLLDVAWLLPCGVVVVGCVGLVVGGCG